MATPNPSPPASALADIQVEEHTNIRALVARVRAATTAAELAPLVDQLTTVLPAHFAHEAGADGVFDTVLARDPAAGRHIDRFLKQHAGFLSDLDAMRAAVADDSSDLIARVQAFCAGLAQHEAEENDVLFDALYIDTGAND